MKKIISAAAAIFIAAALAGCSDVGEPEEADFALPAVNTNIPASAEQTMSAADSEVTASAVDEASAAEQASNTSQTAEESDFTCGDITEEILANVSMSSMAEVGSDRVIHYLSAEGLENAGFSMYICGSGGFADEIAVFSLENIDESILESALESRIESRKKDFEDYNPDEYDKLENALIISEGGYMLFAVTGDNNTAEDIFLKYVG